MGPFEEAVQRLDGIPGISRRVTEEVLAEMGVDMARFPTAAHLASWAKVCPGNNESGGPTPERDHGQRQPLAPLYSGGGSLESSKHQGELPEGPVPSAVSTAGCQAGHSESAICLQQLGSALIK
jgi:hypothetical protein